MHNMNVGENVVYIDYTNSSLISGAPEDSSLSDCLMKQIENSEVRVITPVDQLRWPETTGGAIGFTRAF